MKVLCQAVLARGKVSVPPCRVVRLRLHGVRVLTSLLASDDAAVKVTVVCTFDDDSCPFGHGCCLVLVSTCHHDDHLLLAPLSLNKTAVTMQGW